MIGVVLRMADSSRGLGHCPLKAETGVRFPYPLLFFFFPLKLIRPDNLCILSHLGNDNRPPQARWGLYIWEEVFLSVAGGCTSFPCPAVPPYHQE